MAGSQSVLVSARGLTWASDSAVRICVPPKGIGKRPVSEVLADLATARRDWLIDMPRSLPALDVVNDPACDVPLGVPSDYATLSAQTSSRTIYILHDPQYVVSKQMQKRPPNKVGANADLFPDPTGRNLGVAIITIPPEMTVDRRQFRVTLTHELGHALGLAHALLHTRSELGARDQPFIGQIPMMFPFLDPNLNEAVHQSDRAWLAHLYRPAGAENAPGYGIIRGVVSVGDVPTTGINVIAKARQIFGVSPENLGSYRFSALSGSTGGPGHFLIPVVPGQYELVVEFVWDAVRMEGVTDPLPFSGSHRLGSSIKTEIDSQFFSVPVPILQSRPLTQTFTVFVAENTTSDPVRLRTR